MRHFLGTLEFARVFHRNLCCTQVIVQTTVQKRHECLKPSKFSSQSIATSSDLPLTGTFKSRNKIINLTIQWPVDPIVSNPNTGAARWQSQPERFHLMLLVLRTEKSLFLLSSVVSEKFRTELNGQLTEEAGKVRQKGVPLLSSRS